LSICHFTTVQVLSRPLHHFGLQQSGRQANFSTNSHQVGDFISSLSLTRFLSPSSYSRRAFFLQLKIKFPVFIGSFGSSFSLARFAHIHYTIKKSSPRIQHQTIKREREAQRERELFFLLFCFLFLLLPFPIFHLFSSRPSF